MFLLPGAACPRFDLHRVSDEAGEGQGRSEGAQEGGGISAAIILEADQGGQTSQGSLDQERGFKVKCDYCHAEDHLITACTKKSADRSLEAMGGFLIALILIPFYCVGVIFGAVSSAFLAGFRLVEAAWPYAISKIRSKKVDEHEVL